MGRAKVAKRYRQKTLRRIATTSFLLSVALTPNLLAESAKAQQTSNAGATPSPRVTDQAFAKKSAKFQASLRDLSHWVKTHGGKVSAKAIRIWDGALVGEHSSQLALNPASNMKVVTAAVALELLGPQYKFQTGIYAQRAHGKVRQLVVRGNGDPTLTEAGLWRLSNALVKIGLTEVETLLVDQSYFDAQFVPPAFEQQPKEWAPFRAPVSALAVDRNAVTLNVVPTTAGRPARVWVQPSGAVDVQGLIRTTQSGGEKVAWNLGPAPTPDSGATSIVRLRSQLGGSIAQGRPRTRFRRRLQDPRIVPGWVLAQHLRAQGVTVGDVELGGESVSRRVTYHSSPPLSEILKSLGKHSDNFTAEMVFKTLSDSANDDSASFAGASRATTKWLLANGVAANEFQIQNGSGLFDANRLSANALVSTLSHAYSSPKIRHEFLAHLAIGGVDGTLHYRFRNPKASGRVRGKTGTLNAAITLSGYVLSNEGSTSPVAFSLLVNGIRGRHREIRQRIDRCVRELL